jgi:hypothetical protein
LATVKQFGVLARDFFARLTRRHLEYYLSRELSKHVGIYPTSRFREFPGAGHFAPAGASSRCSVACL